MQDLDTQSPETSDLNAQLQGMRDIQAHFKLGPQSLRDLASEGLRLDEALVAKADAAASALQDAVVDRIYAGLYPWLPVKKDVEILAAHGLPLRAFHLGGRVEHLKLPINVLVNRVRLNMPAEREHIDPETISIEDFDEAMNLALSRTKMAGFLLDVSRLYPHIQADRDMKMRDLLVLRDLIPGITEAIHDQAMALLEAGQFPTVEIKTLPKDCGLQQAQELLSDLKPKDALSLILQTAEMSAHNTHAITLSLASGGEAVNVASTCDGPFHTLHKAIRNADQARRKVLLEKLTAEDVLQNQAHTIQLTVRAIEKNLLASVAAGEVPYAEFIGDMRFSGDAAPYVPTNDPEAYKPMLCEVFAHYMRLKHGVRAIMSQSDTGPIMAWIEI